MSLSDWYIRGIMALAMTVQIPCLIAVIYILIPILIIDFFIKKIKVSLDK
jgi:hypothetical protein